MKPRLRLCLFGGFQLEDAQGRSVGLPLRKAQALIAYLAVVKGQSASRDQLVGLLWAGSDPQRARQSLRQTLATLTKALGADAGQVLSIDGQDIGLVPGAIAVDVVEVEWLLAEGSAESLREAKALFRGDFLAGLTIDAPEFEDWMDDLRGQLRDAMVIGMEELFDLQASGDEIGAAVATGNQVIRIDPLREDMHRKLIALYVRKGMRSSALAQYRACRDILAGELGVEPDRETQALIEDMLDRKQREDRRESLQLDCLEGGGGDSAGDAPDGDAPDGGAPDGGALDGGALDGGGGVLLGPAGGAVEQLRAQLLKTHYQVMTAQLRESGKSGDALAAVLRGARLERKRGSVLAAQSILEQAITAFDDLRDSLRGDAGQTVADLHLALASLAEDRGDLEAARRSLAVVDDLERDGCTIRHPARAALAWSRVHQRSGREGDALDAARRALELLGTAPDGDAWLPAERWMAQLHLSIARAEVTARALSARIESSRALGLVGDEAEAGALLAVIKASRGDLVRGRELASRAVALAKQSASSAVELAAHEAEGLVLLWSGRSEPAISSFEAALKAAVARGDLLREYLLSGLRGAALLAEGRHDLAWSALKQAIARGRDLDTQFLLPFFMAWMAETVCASGRYGDKRPVCEEALRFARESNQPWAASIAGRALARSLADAAMGELEEAERAIDWAICTQRDLGLEFDLARSMMIRARLFELRGQARRAEAAAGEAERLILRIGAGKEPAGAARAAPAPVEQPVLQ